MRFYLTGRLGIESEAGEVLDQTALPGPQGRLALARLVLGRHRPLPVGELAAALWGDSPPRTWETSLRAVVSKLRSALGEVAGDAATIESDARCYQLRAPGAWVDVLVRPNRSRHG